MNDFFSRLNDAVQKVYQEDQLRNSGKTTPVWETHKGAINTDYTVTNYGVSEGFKIASSGMAWNDKNNRVNNNYIQTHDDEFGWLDVVAVNKKVLTKNGKNVFNSDIHNTVIEITFPDGSKRRALVADHCGASDSKAIIDVWMKQHNNVSYNGCSFKVLREGGKGKYTKL